MSLLQGEEPTPPPQGNQVEVVVEEMDGGNYTCHLSPSGEYLNHTLILVQLEQGSRTVILEKISPKGKSWKMMEGGNEGGGFVALINLEMFPWMSYRKYAAT